MDKARRQYRAPLRLRALLGGLAVAGAAVAVLAAGITVGPGAPASRWLLIAALLVTALCVAALAAAGAYALAGRVILDDAGLSHERLGRRRRIDFAAILEIRPDRARGRWLVRAPGVTIPIGDQLEGFVELLAILRARAPVGLPEDDLRLPLRLRASLLGWTAILLLPALLLCGAAASAAHGRDGDVAYALVLPALLWLLVFGLVVPTSIEVGRRQLRIGYLLRARVLPWPRLSSARLVAQDLSGAQSSTLELRFTGRRRRVLLSQALTPFPLPVLLEKIEEAMRASAALEAERDLYNADDRRKNPRALS